MIIGVSGKIGSGKDTVGKIIQYLTADKCTFTDKDIFNAIINNENSAYPNLSNWKIVKFADALKDIICILTGCNRFQLESNSFKNFKLDKEWDNSYGIDTYRDLLQIIGTDLLRNKVHKDVWINALMNKYTNIISDGFDAYTILKKYGAGIHIKRPVHDMSGSIVAFENDTDQLAKNKAYKDELDIKYPYPNWIITDLRFPNELKAIKDRKGITIRLTRNSEKYVITGTGSEESASLYNEHPSEIALDNAKFDYIINNSDGDIKTLIEQVKIILIKESII